MIKIKKTKNGDTRSASHIVSEKELENSAIIHRSNVIETARFLSRMLNMAALTHDLDKLEDDRFYRDFHNSQINGSNFIDSEWYKNHAKEKHHDLERDDINLIDVLEHIIDITVCSVERGGNAFNYLKTNEEILNRATNNTIKLLLREMNDKQ